MKGVEITTTEELLSVPEVGDRLGVSVYTVRRWIKAGELLAYRPGKEYRVRESDLEKFLEAHGPKEQAQRRDPGAAALTELLQEHGLTRLAADQDSWERRVADLDLEGTVEEHRELVREREDFRAIIRGSKWLGSHSSEERRQLNAQLRRRFMQRLNDVKKRHNDLIAERVAELSDEEAEALVETYSRQMEIALGGSHY